MFCFLLLGILSIVSVQAAQEVDGPARYGLTRAQFLHLQAQGLEPPTLRRQNPQSEYNENRERKMAEVKESIEEIKQDTPEIVTTRERRRLR